ncbi:hypothetical protein RIF29_40420 [Crotalaria pallida]|uniref:Uncharacterized protein n=1 Tax=Crotalaria pallida TaxID=3830 RepID=A0AAN9E639_CROPI
MLAYKHNLSILSASSLFCSPFLGGDDEQVVGSGFPQIHYHHGFLKLHAYSYLLGLLFLLLYSSTLSSWIPPTPPLATPPPPPPQHRHSPLATPPPPPPPQHRHYPRPPPPPPPQHRHYHSIPPPFAVPHTHAGNCSLPPPLKNPLAWISTATLVAALIYKLYTCFRPAARAPTPPQTDLNVVDQIEDEDPLYEALGP